MGRMGRGMDARHEVTRGKPEEGARRAAREGRAGTRRTRETDDVRV